MTPGSEDEEARRIPKGSEVEVELLPPSKDKKGKASSYAEASPKWVSASVVDHDTDKAGQVVYICYVPKDYNDKDARRTQSFTPDKVRVLYAPSKMLLSETPQPPKTTMSESPAKRIADFIANAEDHL